MSDRGMIKWQPFESVVSSKMIVNSILTEKNKVRKPILSIDQLDNLNNLIVENYYSKNKISIKYFKNNHINEITGIITHINQNNKIITINHELNLHISQILQINT